MTTNFDPKTQTHYESEYVEHGINSQRRYPNEGLITELAANFFRLSPAERAQTKVLELGCGSGANLWMVAREGFDAHGIDFADSGLKCCHEALTSWGVEAKLQKADMLDLPYDDEAFDFVYDVVSMQCLNYEQHAKAYREVARILKPGGRFYSYTLGDQSVSQQVSTEFVDHATVKNVPTGYPLANNGTLCFLSANEGRKLMTEGGLSVDTIESNTRTYANRSMSIHYLLLSASKPL